MKRFLFHVLICIAALLVINMVYMFTVDGHLRNYERKYLAFPADFHTLVLGDSHTNRAWAASEDPALYNFAYGSDNITDMAWKLDYAIANGNPKAGRQVILSFDPHLVSKYRETKNNNKVNEVINRPWMDKRIPYLLPLIFDRNTELDTKRFFLGAGGEEDDGMIRKMTRTSIRARMEAQYPDGGVSKELLQTYQRLIDKARSHGYSLVAVQYPVHPYYDSLLRQYDNAKVLSHLMDSLARVNKLEIHRFSEKIPDEKYYMDQDHLNKNGSRIFIDLFHQAVHR